MRYVLVAVCLLLIGYVIKMDMQQGALTHTSFYETAACTEQVERAVRVRLVANDTIYSLFATTPSPIAIPFPERLAKFYQLNPHLQKQALSAGELIYVPIVEKGNCMN